MKRLWILVSTIIMMGLGIEVLSKSSSVFQILVTWLGMFLYFSAAIKEYRKL